MVRLRLAKYLSASGIVSRRKAEEYIRAGRVQVNDQFIMTQGYQIDPQIDTVLVDGHLVQNMEFMQYILLNKPVGYLCTLNDDYHRPTVCDLVEDIRERIYPVGRLDMDTEGLLLLTNDGDFAHRIIHPRYALPRKYEAFVQGRVTEQTIEPLKDGIWLEDGFTGSVQADILSSNQDTSCLSLVITIGKKRIVRRILKALGHPVIKLTRVGLGFLTLNGVKKGEYRHLSEDEIQRLKLD